jgi:hypothetical protein
MKNCVSCQSSIESSKKFCGFCGATQPEASNSAPASGANQVIFNDSSPKKKTGLKVFLATFLVAALAVGGYFVFLPQSLTKEDVAIEFAIADSEERWIGDEVQVSASVEILTEREAEFRLVLEKKASDSLAWIEIGESVDAGPKLMATQPSSLDTGSTDFRVSVYMDDEERPFAVSDLKTISAVSAYLPDTCELDAFNSDLSYDETPFKLMGDDKPGMKDCTIGVPNSDYILRAIYTETSAEEFAAVKKKKKGKKVKLGLGETSAFSYWIPGGDLGGGYTAYMVNYHGILVDSDFDKSGIKTLIGAIVVK